MQISPDSLSPPESGGASKQAFGWLLTLLGVGSLVFFYLFLDFRGLTSADGIEQAQIAREVARGNGFTTKSIRPALFARSGHSDTASLPTATVHGFQDSHHPPLPIWVQAAAFSLFPDRWEYPDGVPIYFLDHVTAALGVLFLLISTALTYLLVCRMFDRKLGAVTALLLLFSELFWDFARSGLPQMFMLLLFTAALYALFRAVEARAENRRVLPWLAATAFIFGALTWTHGAAFWIFLGVFAYCIAGFQKRLAVVGIMAGTFALIVTPWLLRSAGEAPLFEVAKIHLYAGGDAEKISAMMRDYETDAGALRINTIVRTTALNAASQFENILALFGGMFLAPLFFLALIHPFRRPEIRAFRWPLLCAWFGAVVGMSFLGLPEGAADPNQLHILFAPIMTAYGLAFVAVCWTRLQAADSQFRSPALANAHLLVIAAIAIAPFAITVYPKARAGLALKEFKAVWPPYIPQRFQVIARITDPNEIIFTDAPWAMAWYGDRTSVWLPKTRAQFDALVALSRAQGNPPAGVLLTPFTTDLRLSSEILNGQFSEWSDLIPRGGLAEFKVDTMAHSDFPFSVPHQLYPKNEIIFYGDRPRFQRLAAAE